MSCVLLPQLSSHQKAALSSNALIYHTRLETLENPGARDKRPRNQGQKEAFAFQ